MATASRSKTVAAKTAAKKPATKQTAAKKPAAAKTVAKKASAGAASAASKTAPTKPAAAKTAAAKTAKAKPAVAKPAAAAKPAPANAPAAADKVKGPASYFPSIEKTYGKPVAHWFALIDGLGARKHMDLVAELKRAHGLGHGHANALVAYRLAQAGKA